MSSAVGLKVEEDFSGIKAQQFKSSTLYYKIAP